MNTYKITNTTSGLAKRDHNFNSTLEIDYPDQMEKKKLVIKPSEVVYFTATSLPLSLRRLSVKKLVTISEVNPKQLKKAIEDSKKKTPPKKVKPIPKAVETKETTEKKRTYKKKTPVE